jgi:hypothetical protein
LGTKGLQSSEKGRAVKSCAVHTSACKLSKPRPPEGCCGTPPSYLHGPPFV